ncbi:uncharacterized protein LOC114243147 isoform X1 [Bombyx mandarina]|uniref:Uncharacterized protein LOC114243147 isoform X1 n=1 Tax=Bombyx mandarina TaxID=7092 RepID=A0A6J2JL32_BOMMA|nr:uncharacterized protein LOC114243147 isoform X1 [Bombyx mandarina]
MPPNAKDSLFEVVPHDTKDDASEYEDLSEDTEVTECSCDKASYGTGDIVFSTFVVAPLVVSVWRGTWQIMDIYENYFPFVESYFMGIIVHISFAFLRATFLARSAGAWSGENGGVLRWIRERLLSKLYTYIFVLSNLTMWRGGWGVLDMFMSTVIPDPDDPHRAVLIAVLTFIFYFSAVLLRSSRNMLASPFLLYTDGKEATYLFTTRFKTINSKDMALYVLDCVFSVSVVGSLVVFVWRGSWALLDIFILPDNLVKSLWISLALGYALVIMTFSLQVPMCWAAARLRGAPRLLLADVYHLVSFFATVNVWRGVWGLLNVYFFPDWPKFSNWCTHIVSFCLLVLLNCSNSILVRGVYIDAEEPDGECVVFPCHYLRLFVHKERTKKRHKRALAAAAKEGRRQEVASLPLQPEDKV